MKVEKTFEIDAPIGKVWPIITDPERIAHCIPGYESVEKTGDDTYKAVIKVAVGPIKTTFKVDIACTEKRPPNFASYETKGDEGGKSSRVKATSTLTLSELSETQTAVSYSSDINIVGRLGKFGNGMMLKVADSMGDDFVAGLKGVVEGKPDADVAVSKTQKSINRMAWIGIATAIAVVAAALIFLL